MKFPVTIENQTGEKLIFEALKSDENGEYLEVSNVVQPGSGPPMHVHFKQDEALTVTKGKIGYQILGEEPKFGNIGETVTFKAGVPHKFWAEGDEVLECTGYVRPPYNIVYFLSEIYKSMDENDGRPGAFDAAYLLDRYKSEFDMLEIPGFVKSVIFPTALFFGKLSGKEKKFAGAPEPIV